MTEDEPDAAGALALDEDQDEAMEEMSLEERQASLKKARWNVFLYLGVAALLFLFALFPMPFSADYDGFSDSAEKDLGFVWGLPLDGEDMFDVPMRLTVTATSPPLESVVYIAVYVFEHEDCTDFTASEKMEQAKTNATHALQYRLRTIGCSRTERTSLNSTSTPATIALLPNTSTPTVRRFQARDKR